MRTGWGNELDPEDTKWAQSWNKVQQNTQWKKQKIRLKCPSTSRTKSQGGSSSVKDVNLSPVKKGTKEYSATPQLNQYHKNVLCHWEWGGTKDLHCTEKEEFLKKRQLHSSWAETRASTTFINAVLPPVLQLSACLMEVIHCYPSSSLRNSPVPLS